MRESHQILRSNPFSGDELRPRSPAIARTSPVTWLNLVCLDAPTVAVTWQWLFARSFHLSLPIPTRAALFLTAWLIYLADRLGDTWSLDADGPLSLRQQFCRRYQNMWLIGIVVIAGLDLWIISRQLDRAIIHVGIFLGAISLAYLAANYWLGKIWRIIPVKELCVGSLFAIGTTAALLPRNDFSGEFPGAFLLFAALCSLNCIAIAIWERELDCAQGKNSIATLRINIRPAFGLSIIALSILGIGLGSSMRAFAPLHCCIGLSAVLLGALDWLGERIPRDQRTALADLVLLTPLFLLPLRIT